MHASRSIDRQGADRSDDPAPTDTPAQLTHARVLTTTTNLNSYTSYPVRDPYEVDGLISAVVVL